AQAQLLLHYEADTPVAICYRLGWPDEQIWLVPLADMAAVTHASDLIRTTLYVISPALREIAGNAAPGHGPRSRLYSPDHTHLFRPKPQE
ncbi:MAG: precorrin-4 C(11)-methyltransferase, partial [Leptolyngbyaceae cyanobacterium SM2_5_2]|nr:precorrin-4 C(11)-methyltransferase [Leptolyngbyaceae cyanobacterium SM2_5_2]